jgi:hypothetical protein
MAAHFARNSDSPQIIRLPALILLKLATHPNLQIRSELQLIQTLVQANESYHFDANQLASVRRAIGWELLLPDEWTAWEAVALADTRTKNDYIQRARQAVENYPMCPRIWLAVSAGRTDLLKRYVEPTIARFFEVRDKLDAKFRIEVERGEDRITLTATEGGFWLQGGEFAVQGGKGSQNISVKFFALIGESSTARDYPYKGNVAKIAAFKVAVLCKKAVVTVDGKLGRVGFAGFSFDVTG